jgi:hypothetical protein
MPPPALVFRFGLLIMLYFLLIALTLHMQQTGCDIHSWF